MKNSPPGTWGEGSVRSAATLHGQMPSAKYMLDTFSTAHVALLSTSSRCSLREVSVPRHVHDPLICSRGAVAQCGDWLVVSPASPPTTHRREMLPRIGSKVVYALVKGGSRGEAEITEALGGPGAQEGLWTGIICATNKSSDERPRPIRIFLFGRQALRLLLSLVLSLSLTRISSFESIHTRRAISNPRHLVS